MLDIAQFSTKNKRKKSKKKNPFKKGMTYSQIKRKAKTKKAQRWAGFSV